MADKIQVLVEAEIKKALKKIGKFEDEVKGFEKKQNNILGKIKDNWLKIAGGIAASLAAVKKAFDFSQKYAEFAQGARAMESQFGVSSQKVLEKLNEVAAGTISMSNLVVSANRAMALNVTSDLDEMSQLLEFARVRARAMGIDTTQAFDDIVTGIGRGSPLILDNLGIITKGWAAEAKAAGQAYDAQFILNKVLEQSAGVLQKTGETTLTASEKFSRFTATIDNISIAIGQGLTPAVNGLQDTFDELAGTEEKLNSITVATARVVLALQLLVNSAAVGIKTTFGLIEITARLWSATERIINNVKENGISGFKNIFSEVIDELKAEAVEYGESFSDLFVDPVKNYQEFMDALNNATVDFVSGAADGAAAATEESKKAFNSYKETMLAIGETLFNAHATQQQKEVQAVIDKYDEMLAAAEEYKIDTTSLLAAQQTELDAIAEKYKTNTVSMLDDLAENWKGYADQTVEIFQGLSDMMNAESQNQLDAELRRIDETTQAHLDSIDARINAENQYQNRLNEIAAMEQEERKTELKRDIQDAIEAGDEALQAEKERELEKLVLREEATARDLEIRKAREEEQTRIEKEAEKKRLAAEKEAFEAEKGARLGMATIETAVAATKALTTPPVVPNLVASGIAAGAGAIQIATIEAQKFPGYAMGGIVDRPTIAQIGEGGMSEAVVPLPDGKTIPVSIEGGSMGGNTYNVYPPTYDAFKQFQRQFERENGQMQLAR
jgi:hypothetical protein